MLLTTELRVALLQVAETLHELLHRDVLVVREQVLLGRLPRVVHEGVCVSGNARHACDHVSVACAQRGERARATGDVPIEEEYLLATSAVTALLNT